MDTSNCGSCGEALREGVYCTACCQYLHYHCGNITEGGYRKLGDRKNLWRCNPCKQAKQFGVLGALTPTVSPSQSTTTTRSASPVHSDMASVLAEIQVITRKLEPLETFAQDLKALRAEFIELKTSVEVTAVTIEKFNARLATLESKTSQIDKTHGLVTTLQLKVESLERESQEQEQWSRMNNIEIKGVSLVKNENLFDIVSKIGSKICHPIDKTKLNFITRIPTRDPNQCKPIIACFQNRYVKENFIAAARAYNKSNPLTLSDLGLKGNQKVFVNDHLTIQNKNLLTKAKSLKMERGFRYLWVKQAKIHMRKDEAAPVITIKTERDLVKIV